MYCNEKNHFYGRDRKSLIVKIKYIKRNINVVLKQKPRDTKL